MMTVQKQAQNLSTGIKNNQEQQQRYHDRKVQCQIKFGLRDKSGKLLKAWAVPQLKSQWAKEQLSPIMYNHGQMKKPQTQSCHTNWFHPTCWAAISDAMIYSKWHLSQAVKLLWNSCGGNKYKTLYPSTLLNWMKPCSEQDQSDGVGQWSEKTLAAVEQAHFKAHLNVSQGQQHYLVHW
ncbi:hypothetical protein BS47DRAFT_1357204 [Hydnum rufescens UP504]|uniref:Uncharacterized protein n=1 Tax=Hydnum rufescens UP504 TaxID=1448309 RepID=A0A9P6E285_9AGAM|nr:hypothetical protein BS47DRAFT_1357204 [Hydnum rufescens UP504]